MNLPIPPVLFIVFSRPEPTAQVFSAIRAARPSRLFVAADGPRPEHPEDAERCKSTRSIATQVDWPCDVQTLFREKNLGCGIACIDAIRWFFSHVEEGIILEDDCLPVPSFFPYCAELLSYFRHDTRVMHIAGYNPLDRSFGDGTYYFSPLMHCWGWATWKRVVDTFDYQILDFPTFAKEGLIASVFPKRIQQRFWLKTLDRHYLGRTNGWDFQWAYMIFSRHGLCVNPFVNLVQNIGFGKDSTFAANKWSYHARRSVGCIETIRHPSFMVPYPDVAEKVLRRACGVWLPRMIAVWFAWRLIRLANAVLKPLGRKAF